MAAQSFGLRIVGAVPRSDPPRRVALWPDNVDAWHAWRSLQTQWRRSGLDGRASGLDYTAVIAYLQAHGHRRPRLGTLLDDLRVCEAVALEEWSRRKGG